MTPPIWLDEACRPCPTYPCVICERETSLYRAHGRHLWSRADWRPYQIERTPSWCGHPSVTVLLPEGDGWWRKVPVGAV